MSEKLKRHKKAHIVGTVQPEHVPALVAQLQEHPLIDPNPPQPAEIPTEHVEPVAEEHVVVAVPKSMWDKIVDFITGN
jgi:hypothetical protein